VGDGSSRDQDPTFDPSDEAWSFVMPKRRRLLHSAVQVNSLSPLLVQRFLYFCSRLCGIEPTAPTKISAAAVAR